MGICRLRVAVEDLPTSSRGNVTQGVGRSGILMSCEGLKWVVPTRGTHDNKVRPGGICSITRFVRASARCAGFRQVVGCNRKAGKEGEKN